jgi:hypothetical protein
MQRAASSTSNEQRQTQRLWHHLSALRRAAKEAIRHELGPRYSLHLAPRAFGAGNVISVDEKGSEQGSLQSNDRFAELPQSEMVRGAKERIEELVMRELALIVAAALVAFNPAAAKVVHRHPVLPRSPTECFAHPLKRLVTNNRGTRTRIPVDH